MRKAEEVKKAKEEEETLYAKEDQLYEGNFRLKFKILFATFRPY